MIGPVVNHATDVFLVAIGGGIGCSLRIAVRDFLVARGLASCFVILGVNLAGAAFAGVAIGWSPDPGSFVRLSALSLLSGWTTYSAFSTDVLAAFRAGRRGRAAFLWIGTIVAAPVLALAAAHLAGGGKS